MMTQPSQNWQLEWSVGEHCDATAHFACTHDVLYNRAYCECEFIILAHQKVHLITSICEQRGSLVVLCLCAVVLFI